MPTVVVSHKNCVDGMVSAAIVALAVEEPLVIMCQYTEDWKKLVDDVIERKTPAFRPDKFKKSRKRQAHDLIVVDFSIPHEHGKRLLTEFTQITFIDHHESSREDMELWKNEKNVKCTWGNDCGSLLAQRIFGRSEYEKVAILADRFDTWKFTDDEAEETFAFENGVRELWGRLVKWDKPDAKKVGEFAERLLDIEEILKNGKSQVDIGRVASLQTAPVFRTITKTDGTPMTVAVVPRNSAVPTSIFGYWLMRNLNVPLLMFSVQGDKVNVSARCKAPQTVFDIPGIRGHAQAGGGMWSLEEFYKVYIE